MAHPLIKVNFLTIRVPPHSGSETGATVNSSSINSSNSIKLKEGYWILDGDSGDWTCPICGSSQKFTINGNSLIKINNKKACISGVTFNIGHNGTLVSSNLEYDENISVSERRS